MMNESIVPLEKRVPAPRQDNQDQTLFGQTPSQTVGPFFHYGLPWKGGADLVGNSDLGARPELFPAEHYVLGRGAVRTKPMREVAIRTRTTVWQEMSSADLADQQRRMKASSVF